MSRNQSGRPKITRLVTALLVATMVAGLGSLNLRAQSPVLTSPNVGAWWGIARACTTNSRFPQPPGTVNQDICKAACGGVSCPMETFPIDEVAMMPEFFADGNMVATDHATLVDGHPIGQGRWELVGPVTVAGHAYTKYQASFMWFQPQQPQNVNPNNPWTRFLGMAHPRFVMYFDPTTPDVMIGTLEPFLFSITDQDGIVNLQPGTPYASPDPTGPLPAVCDPTAKTNPYCFGTFMFVVKRLQPK
jgi:hypothetical protein